MRCARLVLHSRVLLSLPSRASEIAEAILSERPALKHLRVRARGELVMLESGPIDDPHPHLRFRRATVPYGYLEMPDYRGGWERTPFRSTMRELLAVVEQQFPWVLSPVE